MTSYVFNELDDPSAVEFTNGIRGTTAHGINNEGQIVGFYVDASGNSNGFLYSDGAYSTIDYSAYSSTSLYGINDEGQIVGTVSGAGHSYGLLYSNGSYTSFTYSVTSSASADGINNQGQVVGSYGLTPYVAGTTGLSGFQVELQNVTSLVSGLGSANGIDNEGQIVGNVFTIDIGVSPEPSSGFIYDNGVFTESQLPRHHVYLPGGHQRFGPDRWILSDSRQLRRSSHANGFLHSKSTGTWTTIDVPGAADTYVYGINDAGEIVGAYTDSSGNEHGFVGFALPTFPSTPSSNVDEWILSISQWAANAGSRLNSRRLSGRRHRRFQW